MKIDSTAKLFAAVLGILAGLFFPEIWEFIKSLFG